LARGRKTRAKIVHSDALSMRAASASSFGMRMKNCRNKKV